MISIFLLYGYLTIHAVGMPQSHDCHMTLSYTFAQYNGHRHSILSLRVTDLYYVKHRPQIEFLLNYMRSDAYCIKGSNLSAVHLICNGINFEEQLAT